MLCDQPELTQADIAALVDAWQQAPDSPAAAAFGGVIGAPAIVPATLLAELKSCLEGDAGAAFWLRQRNDVVPVTMENAAIDIDRPEDLARLDLS